MTPVRAGDEAAAMVPALEAKVAGFSRLLRSHGFAVGLSETRDAMRVADVLLCTDFAAFHAGMRALLCVSAVQYSDFDRLFEGYWCPADATRRIDPERQQREAKPRPAAGGLPMTTGASDRVDDDRPEHETSGASALEVLRHMDFSQVPAADRRILELLAHRLWQRMAVDRPRRLRGNRWKDRLHLRRTLRRNLDLGGDPVRLVLAGRKPKKPRLVVLLDVSGSMELYSFFLLRLLHALHGRFRRVHSFIFATDLEDVSDCLRVRRLDEALRRVAARRLGWNGGTRLGDCVHRLLDDHGRRVLRPDTAVVVLSDGLDVGAPERLGAAMAALRARSGRILWLNPLLGTPGYQPLAGGMQAALPHIDVFAPAHSVESLLNIGRFLLK